jgi:non-heme Fe2+,alpha-ketoglutarate-dependent halogenase
MKKEKQPTRKERIFRSIFLGHIMMLKIIHFPSRWCSSYTSRIMENWSIPMLWAYSSSIGKKAYMDQPCNYNTITNKPKAEVDEQYRLTPDQIESFHRDGFLGPITAISESEMAIFRNSLENELELDSKAFGAQTVRDRHLDAPFITDLFFTPTITETIAQLLGPDLLIWRSQVFNQLPGAPPIAWHQASTYMLEDYRRPILKPVDKSELFQLTIWIAVDDANLNNGCVQFIPGTHDKIRKVKLGSSNKFYNAHFEMEVDPAPSEVVSMPCKPGQFVIFSERCIHGNPGNKSEDRRMGINFRAITPTTSVYENQDKHYAIHLQKTWDLKNWGVMTLRGEDKHKLSKSLEPNKSKEMVS